MASLMSSSLFSIFTLFLLTAKNSEARDFFVGGNWKIPSPTSQTLNQWAESTRFQVGDSLVWNLNGKKDSVLQVSRESYLICNTSSPIADHKEEENVSVELGRSGAFYFISGGNGACEKGVKLAVVVMAQRKLVKKHDQFFVTGGPALAPLMGPVGVEDGPALAPTSGGARRMVGAGVVGLGMVVVVVGYVKTSF